MFDVKDCISFITGHGAKRLSESMNQQFKEEGYNVTRVQWTALYYIKLNSDITQKELAEMMLIKEPTLLHLIDRLEADGFVVRTYSKQNRRYRYLSLTEEGERVFRMMLPIAEQFNKDAKVGITDEELETFKKVINKMVENVERKNK